MEGIRWIPEVRRKAHAEPCLSRFFSWLLCGLPEAGGQCPRAVGPLLGRPAGQGCLIPHRALAGVHKAVGPFSLPSCGASSWEHILGLTAQGWGPITR